MSMAMAAVNNAPIAAETADVLNCVFSYLFIFLIIKWEGLLKGKSKSITKSLTKIRMSGERNKAIMRQEIGLGIAMFGQQTER